MINQSITVINKSGKVVSTSKHLVSVWKEAKAAYKSRKAEIRAVRDAEHARKALQNVSLSDEHLPRHQDHHDHHPHSHVHRSRSTAGGHRRSIAQPPLERGHSDEAVYPHHERRPSLPHPERDLIRRSTEPPRPVSAGSYDEHLAYGELPPPLPLRHNDTELELRGKMSKLNHLLDEANCLQFTATAMIEHLQKNPDALAAVALTLAEISAMAGRVAPSALMSMKTAFPAVVALLASPEFLIAGGVAVGVTVVMLGGYKIIKKIKANRSARDDASDVTELREIEGDLSRIEVWRRGVADASDAGATSVEGEFITPGAERRLIADGVLRPSQVKPLRRAQSERSRPRRGDEESMRSGRTHRSKHHHSSSRRGGSESGRTEKSSTSKGEKSKKKSVGGIRMLFSRRKSHAV